MQQIILFAEQKNVAGMLESLKGEELENARIFIQDDLAKELVETADKICDFQVVKEILWKAKSGTMGFVDLVESKNGWSRVYRINSGTPLFTEKTRVSPSKIIYIQ